MSKTRNLGVLMSAIAMLVAIAVPPAGGQQARAVGVTPPRLSFIDGEVSYWRPGAEDWVPAQINTALAAGDSLFAGNGANFEIELASRAYVRAGSSTEIGVESLETGYLQLRVPSGHAAVELRRLPEGQQIEVDTPNGVFLISHTGYYRFDVEDDATRFSTRRGGIARVIPAGGDEIEVETSQTVLVSGAETATFARISTESDDAWDRWNFDRTASLTEEPKSSRYVASAVAGIDDLDRYGDWQDTRDYGAVWVPRGVAADWAPYSTGRWVWDVYYGWTWVDDAPWGWAPYHYGRWCRVGANWGWAPGPVVAAPVYSPALVAFFGTPHVGVSVSVGVPFVSWVALGWGEPVVPWWGPRGFVGRPYWGGWGGPRYVNNVQINNTTIINADSLQRYDNFRYRDAVIGIDGDRFGRSRGRIDTVRVGGERLRNLRPVRGELGVRPVRESLVARAGRGARPPDRIQNRRVMATRAPQDPARQPRAAGLVSSDSRRQPAPRIVAPRADRARGRERIGDRSVPPRRGPAGERERVMRDTPERTGGIDRVPAERNRSGRGVGQSIERRGVDRGPVPPRTERSAERTRPDARGSRIRGAEDRSPRERGTAREELRPQEHTRGRAERPEQAAPRMERERRPRMEREAAPHMERQSAPRMERSERRPERSVERPSMQRESRQRQEAPRMQRQEMPRMQRQEAPRMQRQERAQRQEAPRMQRQERAQRQEAPRVQHGGGEPRGGGGRTDGGERGGGKRGGRND